MGVFELNLFVEISILVSFLVSFILNWIGFLVGYCLGNTYAARYGSTAGFGLSLIKWAFLIKVGISFLFCCNVCHLELHNNQNVETYLLNFHHNTLR